MKNNLKKLAESLSSEEIAEIIMLRSTRKNHNSELCTEKLNKSSSELSWTLSDINTFITEKKRGFIVYKAFHPVTKYEKNIDGVVELFLSSGSSIKRKYLSMDYYAIEFLEKAGFITVIEETEAYGFGNEVIQATEKLIDFISEREIPKDEYNPVGGWNYRKVNEELTQTLIDILFDEKGFPLIESEDC